MKRKILLLGLIILTSQSALGIRENESTNTVNTPPNLFSPKPTKSYKLKRTKALYGNEFSAHYHYINLASQYKSADTSFSQGKILEGLQRLKLRDISPKKQVDVLKMIAILKIKLHKNAEIGEAINQFVNHPLSTDVDVSVLRFHLLAYYIQRGAFEALDEQLTILSKSMLPPDLAAYLTIMRILTCFAHNLRPASDEEMQNLLSSFEEILDAENPRINHNFLERNKLPVYSVDTLKIILMLIYSTEQLKKPEDDVDAGEFIESYNALEIFIDRNSGDIIFPKLIKFRCNLLGFYLFHENRNIGYDNDIAWKYLTSSLENICDLDQDTTSPVSIKGAWQACTQELIGHLIKLSKELDAQAKAEILLSTLEKKYPNFADELALFADTNTE